MKSKVTIPKSLKIALDQFCVSRDISRNNLVAIALCEYLSCYRAGSPLEHLLQKDLLREPERVLLTYSLGNQTHSKALKWCADKSISQAQLVRASLIWQVRPSGMPTNWAVWQGKDTIAWFISKADAQLFIRHRPNGEKLQLRQGGRYAR